MHNQHTANLALHKSKLHSHCTILKVRVNAVSKIVGYASWVTTVVIGCSHSSMMYCISKTKFRPGGMVPAEWNRPIRAVRNTLVAVYSAPGINTMRHVAYHPPITVSPILHVLPVSYCNQLLWRCGQLWPYIRIGLLGMRMYCNCNVIGNAAKMTARIPFICAPNVILFLVTEHIIPGCQIYVAVENPSLVLSDSCRTTCSYHWNSVRTDDIISHAENLKSNSCWCFSHL